ncbi:MAG: terminase, partial [Ghiorsea sp.]
MFCKAMFALEGKVWLDNWHQAAICDALERVVVGKTKRLIINIPPRYSKTEIAVVNFMAWSMGLFPESEFIHASYSKRLATNNAYKTRALMMSEAYQAVFSHVTLKDDSKAKDE